MIAFTPLELDTTYNSIPLEEYSQFDKNSGYVEDSLRIYQDKIYKAITDIKKTVNHVWHDEDVNKYGFDLYTNLQIPDPTSVNIVNGETLVYRISDKKYFQANTTATINYITEFTGTPTNFAEVTEEYRTELNFPNGKKDTLFWSYQGSTNQTTMLDGSLNKRSVNNRIFQTSNQVVFNSGAKTITLTDKLSDNIYENDKIKIVGTNNNDNFNKILTISVDRKTLTMESDIANETITSLITFYTQTYIKWNGLGVDKIAIFNTICDDIELKVSLDGVPNNDYEIKMSDTSFITTFELFVFNEPKQLTKTIFTVPKNFNQEFELTFFGNTQEIGEVIYGSSIYMGKTEDTSTIDSKAYSTIVEAPNGDVYFEEDQSNLNVLDRKSFTFIINSDAVSSQLETTKGLINRRLVMSGSIGKEGELLFLLTYGYGKDSKLSPKTTNEESKYTFEIREFK